MDSLLSQAVNMIMDGFPSGGVPDVPREPVVDQNVVELGRAPQSMLDTKARIQELRDAECAELEAQKAEALAEAKAEEEIVQAGVFDLRQELAGGATKEELAKRKADAELARDIAIIKRADARECDEHLRGIRRKWNGTSERINAAIQTVEVQTKFFAIEWLRGGRDCRINNDKVCRGLKAIEHLRRLMDQSLGDPELTERLISDITEVEIPTGKNAAQRILWGLLNERNKEQLADLEPPQPTTKTKAKAKKESK